MAGAHTPASRTAEVIIIAAQGETSAGKEAKRRWVGAQSRTGRMDLGDSLEAAMRVEGRLSFLFLFFLGDVIHNLLSY